jgi:HSP20 family molecular chaperone IbpA
LSSNKGNDTNNGRQIKELISSLMGEQFWNGLCDVVNAEKPRIDMYEGEAPITVLAEAPGILNSDDIFIAIASNKLNIKYTSRDKYQHSSAPGKRVKGECLYDIPVFDKRLVVGSTVTQMIIHSRMRRTVVDF